MTPRAPRALLVVLLGTLATAPRGAAAQDPPSAGVPVLSPLWRALSDSSRAGWVRPLSSAVLPGAGQFLGRSERGALYLIAEAFFLTRFLTLRAEGRRELSRYRNLALDVARGPFNPARRDTTFEYFEQMGKFVESGPFDTDPGPGLAPPDDPQSFNGRIWELAQRTFFPDPANPPPAGSAEYQRALQFYEQRAIGPNFRWSWRNAGLEQDLFRQAIRESDEAFRLASQQLGFLLANHVLSAVDAFVTHRLSGGGRQIEVRTALWVPPGEPAERATLAVTARVAF